MTAYTRHDLPADIAVFAGVFASQPLVFAHLLDAAPELDLGHVEVVQANRAARLGAYFDAAICAELVAEAGDTLVLILPAAFDGLTCPLTETPRLRALGTFRGTVPHLSATP
jgi:hypothetical protein